MSNAFATFRMFVNKDFPELVELYKTQIQKHNHAILNDPHPNSGFDLHFPDTALFSGNTLNSQFVNFQVKGQMVYNDRITGYYVYPRSSISKTPLYLANGAGIIDAGYTNYLIGAFRNINTYDNQVFEVKKHERLLQICHPLLCPILIEWVEEESDLVKTSRGDGGFGSTGK
jgi:dUTP pyrophosphatase